MKQIQLLKFRASDFAKHIIKKMIKKLCGRKISDIVVGQDIGLVSFDIYDTAVRRTVKKPEEVFDLVQERYNKDHEWQLPDRFRELRINAEKEARKKSSTGEVSIQDIYSLIDDLSDDEKSWLLEMETTVEKQVAYCNPEFKKVYESLLKVGCNIVFTSDMYLPEEVIRDILATCGISEFKDIYVSCEYNASKKNGKLYDKVISDFGGCAKRIIHIGDNAWGDYVIPHTKGIKAFLYSP
jgi:predicted HAD superfamily hydrolase